MNLRNSLLSRRLVSRSPIFRSSFLAVVSLFGLAAAARAQTSVYGTVSVEHVTGIQCLQTICGSGDGTTNPLGGFGGGWYDFHSIGPVRLGIDVRAGSTVGNKNAATYFNTARPRVFSVLGGVRASLGTPIFHLHPYVEGAVGLAKSNVTIPEDATTGQVVYHSGIQYRGFAGVDLPLLPALDFRVVELGAGSLRNLGNNYPIESISSGLVLHLPF